MVGLSALYFPGIISTKESPVWYALKGRHEDAVKTNFYYKGKTNEMIDVDDKDNNDIQTFSFRDFCKNQIFFMSVK